MTLAGIKNVPSFSTLFEAANFLQLSSSDLHLQKGRITFPQGNPNSSLPSLKCDAKRSQRSPSSKSQNTILCVESDRSGNAATKSRSRRGRRLRHHDEFPRVPTGA